MLALCVTQWFGIERLRSITALQALTPLVLVVAVPISFAALVTGRYPLAVTAVIPLLTLAWLSYPIESRKGASAAAADAPHLTIAYGNLLYTNPTPVGAARVLLAADADVMVMVELATPLHEALTNETPADDYPHRAEFIDGGGTAIGVWSRLPMVSGGLVDVTGRPTVDVVLALAGRSVRLVGVHPYPPTKNAVGWSAQLEAIGALTADSTLPAVVIGDFNASRWHPSFRTLLTAGLRDSHEALGHGWGASWPTDRGVLPPPFVRIDHALFGDGITPVAVVDLTIPGSDHRGFVVTFGFTQGE